MQAFELQSDDYDDISAGSANGLIDVAFRKIGKNSTAFLIWKIENMNVIAVPKDQYGTFYDTDSYIIYAAAQYGHACGTDTVVREMKNFMEYHIHFWLGSETNPDKSGVAAYKTMELDNYLNGCATQHRETEGNESARFLSYFKNGIKILKPNLFQENIHIRSKLYRVKSKRVPVIKEMPGISWDFFNSSGIFIIHTPNYIFVWIGRATNALEKLQAAKLKKNNVTKLTTIHPEIEMGKIVGVAYIPKIAVDMKNDYNVGNIIFVDDGYEKTLQDDIKKELNKCLPLEKRVILPEDANGEQNGNHQSIPVKLYKCSEQNGKYRVVEIKNGPFQQSDLNPDDVFIVDQDINGIWVWVGRRANDKERSEALRNARGFVKKKKYTNNTRVTRVVDGHEPTEFKALFCSWKDDLNGVKPTILVSKYDAQTMEERPGLAAETQLIDDGSGSLTIWRIKQSHMVEIPKERHGVFFSGDCYIILYTYHTSMEQRHLLYYWLGSQATQEEINNAAQRLSEIDEELGRLGFQARIIQGRETAHFLQLFKGKLIIFKGKGTDYDESGKNLKGPTQYLIQVFGSTTYSSKAIQVSVKASVFDSNYCFVLKRSKKAFIWCGTYSTGDQREMAKGFAGKEFELVLEGKEREDFFNLLGGKASYSKKLVKNDSDQKLPRLFHCNFHNGNLNVEELIFFTQRDLAPEHAMLLDIRDSIYIWIGKLSSKEDQRYSLKRALEYLQTDPSGRDMNVAIIHIKQEKEPPTFIGLFPTWDKKYWKDHKTFSKLRQEIEKGSITNDNATNGCSHDKSCHSDFDQFDKYPINILKESNDKLPAKINPLMKELHLTHDDFVSLFKMPYVEYEKLPRWKQQEMKKRVGLF